MLNPPTTKNMAVSFGECRWNFYGWSTYPLLTYPTRNSRPYDQDLWKTHWFLSIRPAIQLLFLGGHRWNLQLNVDWGHLGQFVVDRYPLGGYQHLPCDAWHLALCWNERRDYQCSVDGQNMAKPTWNGFTKQWNWSFDGKIRCLDTN